jgi:hypothetical protein
MGRTIFVGDVHACRDELMALLDKVAFTESDQLVMVGDLVVRGPDPRGTLELVREVRAASVRGNHEDRLLRYHARPSHHPLGALALATAKALRKRDWALLSSLPLWLDFPAHRVRVVHAGLAPGIPIEQQNPHTLMYARCIDRFGAPTDKRGYLLWGKVYTGPPHVVFGHNARAEPQLHPFATGLDTACVYGGYLTAMVLPAGEAPPPPAERRSALVSVRARKCYVGPRW